MPSPASSYEDLLVCGSSAQWGMLNSMRSAFRRHAVLIFILLVCLFLLTGCGFIKRVFPNVGRRNAEATPTPVAVIDPLPPLRPVRFADFDSRTYLPDRLIIPAIGLDTPVVELGWSATPDPGGRIFNTWDVAEYAAGWHKKQRVHGQRRQCGHERAQQHSRFGLSGTGPTRSGGCRGGFLGQCTSHVRNRLSHYRARRVCDRRATARKRQVDQRV